MEPDPTLDGFWNKALEAWGAEERHRAFVAYCQTTGKLGEAAARYRGLGEVVPDSPYRSAAGDEAGAWRGTPEQIEDAKKRLANIVTVAVMSMETERTDGDASDAHRKLRWIAFLVFIGIMGLLAYALVPS